MDARSKALRTADFQFQYRTKRSSGCLIIAASTPPKLVGRGSFVCDTEPGILDFTDDVRQGRLSVWHSTRMVAGKAKQTWRDGNSTTWRIRASQRRGHVDAEIYAGIGAEARSGTNSCPHENSTPLPSASRTRLPFFSIGRTGSKTATWIDSSKKGSVIVRGPSQPFVGKQTCCRLHARSRCGLQDVEDTLHID